MLLLFCVAFDVAVVVLASARVLLRPAVDGGVVVVAMVDDDDDARCLFALLTVECANVLVSRFCTHMAAHRRTRLHAQPPCTL